MEAETLHESFSKMDIGSLYSPSVEPLSELDIEPITWATWSKSCDRIPLKPGSYTIQSIWNSVFEYGYHVRKNNLNGLKSWQSLKKTYEEIPHPSFSVKANIAYIVSEHYKLGADVTDHTDCKFALDKNLVLDNKIEIDHFFIQHFRIPYLCNYNLSVLKLLQISYNAGQFFAGAEKRIYNMKIANFYNLNDLSSLNTYISDSRVNDIINV